MHLPTCWLCLTAVSLTIFLVLSKSAEVGWSALLPAEVEPAGLAVAFSPAAVAAAAAAAAAAALASRSSFFRCVICAYVRAWPSWKKGQKCQLIFFYKRPGSIVLDILRHVIRGQKKERNSFFLFFQVEKKLERQFISWYLGNKNKFGSMTARNDDTSPSKLIFSHKKP